MTDALLACQDENGSWRPSLLDPEVYPTPENSGSAFFTYGLAWGVNHGILKGKVYRKAAKRSWKTLCSYVREDGRMEYVQPVGAGPASPSRIRPKATASEPSCWPLRRS